MRVARGWRPTPLRPLAVTERGRHPPPDPCRGVRAGTHDQVRRPSHGFSRRANVVRGVRSGGMLFHGTEAKRARRSRIPERPWCPELASMKTWPLS